MYKLVIADDERRIRQGLKNIVDWNRLGFEVTELFADGQEVIEYLEYVVPDVILTDIKMNNVSGLEVAKYVYENELPCKVVLISGYQEFDLAVQGIKYGAGDYLLKPTDVDQLEQTFTKIRQQLDEKYAQIKKRDAEKERMEEAIPFLEESFFADVIMGVTDNEEYMHNCLRVLYPDRNLDNSPCMLVDIYIEDFEHFMDQEWKSNYDQFEINLRNFLRIYQNGYIYHIVYKNKNFLELIGMKMDTEQGLCAEPHVDELLKELEQTFHFRATYMIRQEYDNIYQIKKLRKQMRNETDEAVFDQYLQEQQKMITSNLIMGNIMTAQKLLHSILDELENLPLVKRNNMIIEIMMVIFNAIREIDGHLASVLEPYFNYAAVLSMIRTEEIKAYLDRIFDRMQQSDAKKEAYDTVSLVSKAQKYIRDNIYKDISQEETANYLYICPSYLSRMFKKQTGENFLQYVTRVKMEKAVELLRDPQYKAYQVSEMLGYKTPKYFARLFRNHTGMNPSEYRSKTLHLGDDFDENQ